MFLTLQELDLEGDDANRVSSWLIIPKNRMSGWHVGCQAFAMEAICLAVGASLSSCVASRCYSAYTQIQQPFAKLAPRAQFAAQL